MAARADCAAEKMLDGLGNISWHLKFSGSREPVSVRPLQGWRVDGEGRTHKERMLDYANRSLQAIKKSAEEQMDDPAPIPAEQALPLRPGSPNPTVEEGLAEDRGQSSGITHPIVEEAETMIIPSREPSPSNGSELEEFTNADGYVSGQEEIESEKDELEDDDVHLTIEDAHFYKIFQDEEKREPACILELGFDSKKGHRPNTTLHLTGCTSRDSSELFMRTIDSWKIKPDGENELKMYVRDTKGGLWIKLWKHSREYEVSVRDALIIIKFLELAMISKETIAKKFLDELVDKIGSRRIEIKRVLLKYYSSVVEKFVQSEKAPSILQKAPIIKKMEFLLRGKLEKVKLEGEERIAHIKRPSTNDERKLENSSTPGVQSPGNKRRRIEESDPDIIPKQDEEKRITAPDTEIVRGDDVGKERKETPGVQSPGNKRRWIEESGADIIAKQEVKNKITEPDADIVAKQEVKNKITEPDAELVREDDVERKKNVSAVLSNKRKRVVESDAENESDSEDHVPLAQRQFSQSEKPQTIKSQPTDEQKENMMKREEPDVECEGRKRGQDGGACSDPPLCSASNQDGGFLRLGEECVNFEGEQEFQDIAEIYGGQSDGIGEIEDGDDEELGESAFCAICDDGGDLLLCDGPCMRSFHASKESTAQSDSKCRTLGYTAEEVREMGSWRCQNCVHNQHQCFICGQLGKSVGNGKEVHVCDVALCGRFFHPNCLAKWKKNEKFNGITDEDAFIRRVKEGVEEFCCPAHKCRKCGEAEDEDGVDNSRKLAKCRRCPKAYHKLCLPKKISFEGRGDEPVRAWEIGNEDDPMKRLVIYCLDHPIIEHYSTPARNHLKWPKDSSSTQNVGHKNGQRVSLPVRPQQKLIKSTSSRQMGDEITHQKNLKGTKDLLKQKLALKNLNVGKRNPWSKPNIDLGSSVAARKAINTSHMPKRDYPVPTFTSLACPTSKHVVPRRTDLPKKHVFIPKTTSREGREDRVLDIIRRASQNVTLETVKQTLVQPSCYAENRKKNFLQKGELQSLINAARKALEKVDNGGSREDAKRLCPKDKFIQLLKTQDMLKVHLSPILHGARYSSFGRHFTSPDKLREIVNRIHPYIDSGDMIVDFCCGANDFSIILNEKLLNTGKHCHFKNFDIHPPKNEFCFTKGDWLTNTGDGFLEGKNLIMGLNPPFGVRAQLANRFIIQALKFRPKLLVLIVPPETMSYSENYKSYGYDLVWEDRKLLEGHAFYLPGSVNNNDSENVTQWNIVPPPLYLWSTRETLQNHREIAVRYGHVDIGRTSTQTPPPTELSRGIAPSDKRTNSGSTPTEYDTSSSRLQHSSSTSSQNSLEGSGLGGHHASQRGQTPGEQASDPAARHLMHLKRTESFRQAFASPVHGLPHKNFSPAPSHSHLNLLNQSAPWISPGFQNPPQSFQCPPAGQQLWPVRPPQIQNFPINHGFPHQPWGPPPTMGSPTNHGFPHQPWLQPPPPPPHFHAQGFLPSNPLHGLPGHSQGETLPPPPPLPPPPLPEYLRGHPPQLQRRPGGNQHSAENGSGGWLD